MKHAKKPLSLVLALLLTLALFTGSAFASGAPSGDKASGLPSGDKASGLPSGDKKTDGMPAALPAENTLAAGETAAAPQGVTTKDGTLAYGAEDGSFVVMTENGQVVAQTDNKTYTGSVVFEAEPYATSTDGSATYRTQSILTKNGGALVNEVSSALNGTVDANGISGANITADAPNMSVVTVIDDNYAVSDSSFHILQTGDHTSGGNDFTGDGCAIAVTGGSRVTVDNVSVTGDGVTRTCLYGGLSTRDNYPTVYVSNSSLTSTGDPEGEDCAVWVLGLHGVVRTCQFCDYYDIYYYNTVIDSYGWACLSVDGTEYPTVDDLTELSAAYVDGQGYKNADGSLMTVADFAVAATGLTDEYLAKLDAVDSKEALQALPNTNDYSLYYFAGKNTLVDSALNILDLDTTGTGYSSYSIGANINVYSGCSVNADYGNVEANEYASSAYVNGTLVNARKSIVMCHSNAGGVTMCADSTLNAGEVAFIYKGTGSGYTQENLDASVGMMVMGATGSNLYVRNCKVTAPVLVLAFDSDDPGALGGTTIELDDSIAPKDESFDVTNAANWGPASTMWFSGGSYNYNEAVQAYFEDCTGETALNGDIFNCHQFTSKNLVVTLDNCQLTGAVSSGFCVHDVDVLDRAMSSTAADEIREDGLRYGNRENLGSVVCTPAETVNNGVILSLENGTVWNVTETSYVSVLNIDATSSVNGTVTVLPNGVIKVEPAAGAAKDAGVPSKDAGVPSKDAGVPSKDAGVPAAGDARTEDSYKQYLKDYFTATPDVQANLQEFCDGVDAGSYDEFPVVMAFEGWFAFVPPTLDEYLAGAEAPLP